MTEDVVVFGRFWESIKDHLSALKKLDSPLGIAYSRFETALFERNVERCIASAVMCIEALYLSGGNELAHRLSQRVACLFGAARLGKSLELYDLTREAYKIRNAFVHGNVPKSKNRAEAMKIREKILDIARLSLVAFLLLEANGQKKDSLIEQLDKAMLDGDERNTLEQNVIPVREMFSLETN